MKKLIILVASIFTLGLVVNAQDTLRNQAKTQIQKRDRIHQEEHLMFMDGKLYRMQNGVRTQVQNQVQLRDGGVVNAGGSYQLKNKERMQLQNGECLDLNGNRYQNQRMFNQRRMMTQQEMMQRQNRNMPRNQMHNNRKNGRRS